MMETIDKPLGFVASRRHKLDAEVKQIEANLTLSQIDRDRKMGMLQVRYQICAAMEGNIQGCGGEEKLLGAGGFIRPPIPPLRPEFDSSRPEFDSTRDVDAEIRQTIRRLENTTAQQKLMAKP